MIQQTYSDISWPRVVDKDGAPVPEVISTNSAPASPSKVSDASSPLRDLRLILGRFANDRAPVLSSFKSSVGLAPRLPFVGEEGSADEECVVVGPLTPLAYRI